jgi:hypothetical protein
MAYHFQNILKVIKSNITKPDNILVIIYLIIELSLLNILPEVQMDEPWYGNTAFNFANHGFFTNTNVGYSGGDLFCLPSFITGVFFKIFGCSLWVSRLSSVLGGYFALIGFIKLMKALKINAKFTFYSALLFIFSNVFFIIFRTARPESWVISLGIWSLFSAYEFYQTGNSKYSIFAGILAALSLLAHPYGILSVIDSGIMMIIAAVRDRKVIHLFQFGASFLLCFGLPVIYCLANPDYSTDYLFREFTVRNSITARSGLVGNFIIFFTHYALGLKRLYILIFEIIICFVGLFLLRKEKILWIFPLLGIFNFVFSVSMFSQYLTRSFGQVILYSLLTFALIVNMLKRDRIKLAILALAFLYFTNNLVGDIYFITKNIQNQSYSQIINRIGAKVPDNAAVASMLEFWYAFPYNDFYCNCTEWHFKNFNNIEDLIKSNYLDYIVLSDYFIRGYTSTSGRIEPVDSNYIKYYHRLLKYARESAILQVEFDGGNYDMVKIWKVIK